MTWPPNTLDVLSDAERGPIYTRVCLDAPVPENYKGQNIVPREWAGVCVMSEEYLLAPAANGFLQGEMFGKQGVRTERYVITDAGRKELERLRARSPDRVAYKASPSYLAYMASFEPES